jgi:hypothetical protein
MTKRVSVTVELYGPWTSLTLRCREMLPRYALSVVLRPAHVW